MFALGWPATALRPEVISARLGRLPVRSSIGLDRFFFLENTFDRNPIIHVNMDWVDYSLHCVRLVGTCRRLVEGNLRGLGAPV